MGAAASVATALAVLAVLAVLASATVAAVSFGGDDEPGAGGPTPAGTPSESESEEESDADTERFFPDGQVLTGDRRENANLEIPSVDDGWTLEPGVDVGFISEQGNGSLRVNSPYVYDSGFCRVAPGSPADRAWVGFPDADSVATDDDSARQVAEETAELWRELIFESSESEELPDIDYTETEISDGTSAIEARFFYEIVRGRDRCTPPANELRFLTFQSGEDVAVVVMRRDVTVDGADVRGGLSGADAEEILTSARIQQED